MRAVLTTGRPTGAGEGDPEGGDVTGHQHRYHHGERARELARRLWRQLEVVHTPAYFAPEFAAATRELGLDRRMRGYVAIRGFALGAVPASVVEAAFFGFAPRAVAMAVPTIWERTSPAAVDEAVRSTVARWHGERFADLEAEVDRAAELVREAALLHPHLGRPLAAAWSEVAWSDDPTVVLWQAASRIRESRGDGHVALLVANDLDGPSSHLTLRGDSARLRERLTALRGWTDAEWAAGAARLRERGLLDEGGWLTAEGRELRQHLEVATDDLAAGPWQALGGEAAERLSAALQPLVARIAETEVLPGFLTRDLP